MAKKSGKIISEFKYEINPDFDFVLEDGQNTSICMRKISWNDKEEKVDIRKYMYQNGEEQMRKGVSLSDPAVHEMVNILTEHDYGDTRRMLKALRQREEYEKIMSSIDEPEEEELEDYTEDEEYYDPSELVS